MRRCLLFTLAVSMLSLSAGCGVFLKGSSPESLKREDINKIVAAQENLQILRRAILSFAAEHKKVPESLEALVEAGFLERIPIVTISGSRRVISGPIPENPTSKTGDWYFDPSTGELRIGITGATGPVPITSFLKHHSTSVVPWNW